MHLPKLLGGVRRRPGEASTGTVIAIVSVVVLCFLVIVGSGVFMWYFWTQEPDAATARDTRPPTPNAAPGGGPQRPTGSPSVGDAAPEIVGQDVDGKEFKLSDYRGKVIVLDFWAGW